MYRILCRRSAGSILGPGQAYLKDKGEVLEFFYRHEAMEYCDRLNKNCPSKNVKYEVVSSP